jgi:hypothetical protein
MASPLFPALAAGALLALLTQIPPSLNAAQRLLPVVWRPGQPEGLGSLSHRAPRHAAPRVLHRRQASGIAASAPAHHSHGIQDAWRPTATPRRPWGFSASALSGPAKAGGLPPQTQRAKARRSPALRSPSAHR